MKTESSNNDAAGPLVCRICGNAKAPHNFCCSLCWKSLPQELRTPFVVQKLRCLAWLREHHQRMERIEAEYLTPPDCGLSDAEEQAFDKEWARAPKR